MTPVDPEELRDDLRQTIHKLNNLLTTMLVQGESLRLTSQDAAVNERATRIVDAAEEAESVLRACRSRLLEPEPDLEASFPPAAD